MGQDSATGQDHAEAPSLWAFSDLVAAEYHLEMAAGELVGTEWALELAAMQQRCSAIRKAIDKN